MSAADIHAANLVLVYYWMQIDRLSWRLNRVVKGMRDRLMIGACSDVELQRAWRKPGLAMLSTLPAAVFANNLKLANELEATLARDVFYTPNGVDTNFFRPASAPPPPAPHARWLGGQPEKPDVRSPRRP